MGVVVSLYLSDLEVKKVNAMALKRGEEFRACVKHVFTVGLKVPGGDKQE
jgi:hypothetical protein